MPTKALPNAAMDEIKRSRVDHRHGQCGERDLDGRLKSRVIKRSLVVGGHKTSVSLEDVFWEEFRAMAQERHVPLSHLAADIDDDRQHGNLSSAIRLFVFENRRKPAQPAAEQSSSTTSADRRIVRR
jgi:predicted DNA-binding ribbon-helix-helix protein